MCLFYHLGLKYQAILYPPILHPPRFRTIIHSVIRVGAFREGVNAF